MHQIWHSLNGYLYISFLQSYTKILFREQILLQIRKPLIRSFRRISAIRFNNVKWLIYRSIDKYIVIFNTIQYCTNVHGLLLLHSPESGCTVSKWYIYYYYWHTMVPTWVPKYVSWIAIQKNFDSLCRCSLESGQNKIGILVMASLYILYSVQQYGVISQPRSLKLRFVNQLLKILFAFIIKNIMCIVPVCLINLCLAL